MNLTYTVMRKRLLLDLVQEGHVAGWDDPRMPTIVGMRRRGYTSEAIRAFCDRIGVARRENLVDVALLEHAVREDLNKRSPRIMGVLDPLRVAIENYPEAQTEEFEVANSPEDPAAGSRRVPFSRELFIEREDFMEDPPKKFFRLAPGREVRLRGAYFITCTGVVKDSSGAITGLRCTYDPATRGGDSPDGRKVKATLHWVAVKTALEAEVRLYDRLFTTEQPGAARDYRVDLNPESLQVRIARVEPTVASAQPGDRFQFERLGYFCVDPDTKDGRLVFNRTVTLKDSWAKAATRHSDRR
jgi:glutaminyl-tRNA synthetase